MSPRDIEQQADSNEPFVLEATREMCFYCFDILLRQLQGDNQVLSPLQIPETAKSPLFVTWETQKGGANANNYGLRGCIGVLSPQPLHSAIGDYALLAAMKDRRFDPIVLQELPNLRVGVSLLVQYEPCRNVYDWQVGVHGILIKFTTTAMGSGEEYSATFLPEVAKEQRWTLQDTVQHLIRKAGYSGPIDENLLNTIRCTRYQSSKCRVTYQDYVQQHLNGVDPAENAAPGDKKRWCFSL